MRRIDKNIRFNCANFDFQSGHCKAHTIANDYHDCRFGCTGYMGCADFKSKGGYLCCGNCEYIKKMYGKYVCARESEYMNQEVRKADELCHFHKFKQPQQ